MSRLSYQKKALVIASSVLCFPRDVFACPFCDLGGRDTAWFLATFLGIFAAGMICFLVYFVRRGGFKNSGDTATFILKVEGVECQNGESKNVT